MKILINLLVFCIVLFLYLHIYYHLKTSNDLEIYEIEQPSKEHLEEICDLRQPVLLDYNNNEIISTFKMSNILDTYGAFDIKIRNVKEYDSGTDIYLPIAFNNALDVFKKDKEQKYISEKNSDFIEETTLIKTFSYNDEFLRPYMVAYSEYDYIMGSTGAVTPFRYELNYRNYFLVTEGKAHFRLTPYRSYKYLYTNNDYEHLEFRSQINPWNVDKQYKADFNKIKCLDVTVNPGQILQVPAYWYYSIKYESETSICVFKYRTYMNTLAISPQLILNILQNQNIKRQVVKCAENNEQVSKESTEESPKESPKESPTTNEQTTEIIKDTEQM